MIAVEFRDPATDSVLLQAEYFADAANPDLATRWKHSVDRTLAVLQQTPETGVKVFLDHPVLSGLRRVSIEGFPRYLLFYRFLHEEQLLIIYNVLHGARDVQNVLQIGIN